jgi:hypothetical protein
VFARHGATGGKLGPRRVGWSYRDLVVAFRRSSVSFETVWRHAPVGGARPFLLGIPACAERECLGGLCRDTTIRR